MTEKLLQFIWQFQYFNKTGMLTITGEPLQIIITGQYNHNQGPDFQNAKIKIQRTTWAGSIELHIRTSDWNRHRHEKDANYKNVVLHVVWEHDVSINAVPVFELKSRVSKILLERYEELMNASSFIPCEKLIHTVSDITWKSWKERLLAERLLRKAAIVDSYLQQNNYHWEEVFWWLLARNFGMKVNGEAFEAIARSIPLTVLAKHKQQIHQLEALLLGQGGLLENKFTEDYPLLLQREYRFFQNKLSIRPVALPLHFLRMRPGNFPTIRLAQLAMLVHHSAHLFSKIREARSTKEVRELFEVTANDYWHYHYRFDESSAFKKKTLGVSMIDNIIINTIVPVLFAYGSYHKEQKFKNKALEWLEETAAEKNSVVNGFLELGIENKNAFDSQGLIELKNEYCNKRRCLECGVGNVLLKSAEH